MRAPLARLLLLLGAREQSTSRSTEWLNGGLISCIHMTTSERSIADLPYLNDSDFRMHADHARMQIVRFM